MHSKKKLFATLAEMNIPGFENIITLGLKHPRVSDETYGQMSCIYIRFASQTERRNIERELKKLGFRVHADYWPESSTAEVQVSYFKGWHYDV